MCKDAALEEGSQFPFHEAGHHTVALALAGQIGFELFRQNGIENALFGTTGR
jgi:hypothetical protein